MKKGLFVLLFVSQSAVANWGIEIHLYTQHFVDMEKVDLNEKNYGGGIRYQFSDNWAVLGGVYQNSVSSYEFKCNASVCSWEQASQSSRYLSFERSITESNWYEFGIGFGVADGYDEFINENGVRLTKDSDYQPMAGPYLNIGNDISVKIRYMFSVASLGMQYVF